ncbi:hypothetical protein QWY85_19385 [Neolewinella lacunae]|uniref:Uncharacterized protein n=1 Tax=Neolewinella lacunae TaxID=1517758 RepID=A0A923PFW2_9BACT|nr:hypothetical protein [Neolewinella lacunae]MBC6993317.1 hypothetical protein [Neolewinella lacunae]MDN3636842.1 hypothetical protein [Neolewinella lacunae]
MEYRTKLQYAERVAEQLQGKKSTAEIETELKQEGLFERDIINVMTSARNILADKYAPLVREILLGKRDAAEVQESGVIDNEILTTLIWQESNKLAIAEKRAITRMVKENYPVSEIIKEVDTRFLTIPQAKQHIEKLQQTQQQNSGSNRIAGIMGGLGLILLSVIVLVATDRFFFFIPIIGIIMIGKALATERMAYED